MNRVLRSLLTLAILMIALLAGVVPTDGTPAATVFPAPSHAAAQDLIASLDPVEGLVLHQTIDDDPQDLDAWTVLTEPVLVNEGDRIRTGPDGLALLTFFEGVQSEIRPNAYVVVSTLALGEATEDVQTITLDQLAGLTLVNIETTLDAEDRFELHTPGATVVVRGTNWWTLVTREGRSQFLLERGAVGVLPTLDPDAQASTGDWNTIVQQRIFPFTAQDRFAELGADGNPPRAPLGVDVIVGVIRAIPDAPLPPATCGDGTCQAGELPTCLVDCINDINLAQCSNGICEPDANENLITCPGDCGPFPGQACGNGTCDPDESYLTCPNDCAPGEYFGPVYPFACGNGICDVGETGLACPADCAGGAAAHSGDQCIATANAVNLRGGPGMGYPISGYLVAGEQLIATGQSADGGWLYSASRNAWVARFVVIAVGPCGDLPVQTAPPPPVVVPLPPPADPPGDTGGTGGWGGCGSCDTCGDYPAGECVTTPTGECVWDPSTCAVAPPVEDVDPYLVVPSDVTCNSLETIFVPVQYVAADGATIDDHTASSSSGDVLVNFTTVLSPTTFKIELYCIGTSGSSTINAKVWDTQGRVVQSSFNVTIN
ncbi:MAG: FecR domain-containing protein [Anaerolineae bacterium]|nr:FecR domain-containing protein [Anaerolineae bacterium]